VTSELTFQRIALKAFRNIAELEFEPAPRLNVIAGDNGHGKTSLLEALYLVATTRSFRVEKLGQVISDGQEAAVVRAQIREAGHAREQFVSIGRRGRSVRLGGKRPEKLSSYATRTPVVVFHPRDLELVSGGAAERRRLLDRISLYVDPRSADAKLRYGEALRERQKILEERGGAARDLDAYETLMAEHGARLSEAHARAAERLVTALVPAFSRLAAPGLRLEAVFEARGHASPEEFARELRARRSEDLRRGTASFGPQRDELALTVDGRSARHSASQGQQRVLTLALKSAELECIREARGAHPVLLLDDVSSELDPSRTGGVYEFLRDTQSQVFVTTTRPELFPTPGARPGERADFVIREGHLLS
jgi:DNA replication and repair protein RecF